MFDEDGRHVGTRVTREVEWDDTQRDRFEALAVYESGICSCGFHESLTNDLNNVFQPGERTCNVCAGNALWHRVTADADEKAMKRYGENPSPRLRRPEDGRHLHMRLLPPWEVEEMRAKRNTKSAD